jgi:DNA-binding LacI/PurR family transcriptional regulator
MTDDASEDTTARRPPRSAGSIHEVARAAGVGVATVSRVVNGKPGVSDEMRAYIHGIMRELRYTPKAPERRPGRRQPHQETDVQPQAARVIDLFIAFPLTLGEFPLRAPIYSRMLDEIDAAATRAGVDLYVRQRTGGVPADLAPSVVGRIYFARGNEPTPGLTEITAAHLPQVWVMGGDPVDFTGDSIRVDHERIGEIAAHHLYQQGHRHACYLGTAGGYSERLHGMRATVFAWHFTRLGGTADVVIEPSILDHRPGFNSITHAALADALDRCLRHTPRPSVLFLEFAMFAPPVWALLAERGIRPGIDLDVIVCNNDSVYLDQVKPRPQVIDIPCRAMAELALDLVLHHRERALPGFPVRHLVAPELLR